MHEQISVIIPVKNDEGRIGNCLKAVFSQTIPPFEVIVVDGHSSDGTVAVAKDYQVRLIYEEYGTVGGARQIGVENATGEYIAFTDSDCIPEKNWLEMLLANFSPDLAGVGGGIKNIGEGIWEQSIALALDSFLGSANSVQDHILPTRRYVRSLSGCNSCYRRSDIERAGGFKVQLRFNEDTDLNNRIATFGPLLYTPDAIVIHDQSRSLKQFAKRMFLFGKGRAQSKIFDLQILPPLSLVIIIPGLFLFPIIVLPLIILYLMILFMVSLSIAQKNGKIRIFPNIFTIFILEHVMYSLGFWFGALRFNLSPRKTRI